MASPREATAARVPFFDLKKQLAQIRPEIDQALASVLEDGTYTNGPAVETFEREFAAYCGVPHAVAVNNGTSALQLVAVTMLATSGCSFKYAATARRNCPVPCPCTIRTSRRSVVIVSSRNFSSRVSASSTVLPMTLSSVSEPDRG